MAFSKPLALLLLLAVAATATCAAGQQDCSGHKVTVQNLCGHDLNLGIAPVADSKLLRGYIKCNGMLLPHGNHQSFDVCAWTGSVSAQGAAVAKFHLGHDGGAYYEVSTDQASSAIHVSVTPHGNPLLGHCPTAGCNEDKCFEHSVPGGNCHGVSEMKVVYYKKH